jgi:hypothetical protein
MKKLLVTSLLAPASALAHTGHLSNESVHGFLHIEHIIMLAAAGLIIYLVKALSNK